MTEPRYREIQTLAVFASEGDQNYVAVILKAAPLTAEDVAPKWAALSAFGDTPAEAVAELAVAMQLVAEVEKETL